MNDALFVSDLHLDAARPRATAAFLHLLENEARSASRLFILGDLFEFWIGDDDDDPLAHAVIAALADYTASGHACLVMRGNRDFLLGDRFAAMTGARLLDDPVVEDICGQRVLLTHGDRLCTDDVAYQRHRRRINNRLLRRLFLGLPRTWRRAVGAEGRRRSRKHTTRAAKEIMDVNQEAVRTEMARHGVRLMVHGHTHRPAVHHFELDDARATRIVLGDWYLRCSVLSWSAAGYELKDLPFSEVTRP